MQINGREVKFLRTVWANCRVADMCPAADIKNIKEIFKGSYQHAQMSEAKFMAIMSEAYEQNRKFNEPGYEPRPLTTDEALNLTDEEFGKAFVEALEAYSGEKPTVETDEKKTLKEKAEK